MPSFLPGSPHFFCLSTSSLAVSQLFDIFPEETVLCFIEPVASRQLVLPSPHTPDPHPFPPLINKTDLQMQLWKQAPAQSHPGSPTSGSRQPGSHVIESSNASNSLTALDCIPCLHFPHLGGSKSKGDFPLLYEAPRQPKRHMSETNL